MDNVKAQNGIDSTMKTTVKARLAVIRLQSHFTVANALKVIVLVSLCLFIYKKSNQSIQDDDNSLAYLVSPKVNDIYFLDFRILSENLRPNEKYRIAKVVDITGDIVTLLYGNVFYLRQQSLKDSIRYGQLRYKDYFESKRYDLKLSQLKTMHESSAIYMIKRPDQNMLYGNYINDPKPELGSTLYIPGKRENIAGLSFKTSSYQENNLQQAFERFSRSAQLGFAQGQINLAQMYLNGEYIDKDLSQAMYWFKQAALQSDKAGVLKYVIVCRQVSYCQEGDFYQELTDAGVNIKVRKVDFKLN
ncbi:tetratricopeptide repeat protein [Colwellia sp. 12G3]|uniref:tetratricopeptide repeat protein n=1 Tax=Colwellia sp. 12G3 TaxID=2058299 RepID=UPI000C32F984|nr:SEL1-like repeat protein [Colwellia sp. 12G3]PKI12908.1 sel1 repeat family protein [Colwellia sp. 12G3]